jgi:hypothetical protein
MELGSSNEVAQVGFDVSSPLRSFARTVRAVVVHPGRFFRDLKRQESSNNPVLFAGICILAALVLPEVLALLGPLLPESFDFVGGLSLMPGGRLGAVGAALWISLIALPGFYLLVAVQYLFVAIFVRQGRSFDATLCAIAYSSVFWLFEGIPVVGYLVTLYSIYVSFLGMRELHPTTTIRALLAVLAFNALLWAPQIVSLFRSLSDRVFG